MRISHYIFIATPLLATLVSCATPPEKPAQPVAQPEVIKRDFSSVKDTSFRGQLSFDGEQARYTPCNSKYSYPVRNNVVLKDVYKQITGNQDKPVYAEFDGEISFNRNNDAKSAVLLRVDQLHHMALAKASLQCAKPNDSYDFKAQGDAPYWRINMQEQKLFFATKASNQSYLLKDADFKASQSNLLKSENEDGQPLLLSIEPAHCFTNNATEYWGYTTKAETIFGTFTGCGEPGRLSIEQDISGFYLNKQANSEINLTFNSDYTLDYKKTTASGEVTKKGFWKSNTPGEVVVMLTKQGKKKIREEVIFQRNGLTLTTSEINRNNIITSFDAMSFKKMDKQHSAIANQPVQIQRQFTAQRISPEASVDKEVQAAVQQYFKIHRTDPNNTKFNSVRFDLNGDGLNEAIVLLDWCSQSGCELLIFENKNNKLRFSSRISQVNPPIIIAKQQHFSWQSLLLKENNQLIRLNFDGLSYPLTSKSSKDYAHASDSTGVILFNQGRPNTWFPIQ